MKLTRRQLNQLIAESLNDDRLDEKANLIQRAKNAFNLYIRAGRQLKKYHREKDEAKKEEMLDKLCKILDKLKTAADAGDFEKGDINQATVNAALSTIKELEGICQGPPPSPEKVRDIIDDIPVIKPEPDPEPNPYVPDPDPNSEWEFILIDCVWYARKKGETRRGVRLGRSKQTWGKYKASIAILDKAYPELVKDCPKPKKPTPKPKPDPDPETIDPDPPDPTPGNADKYVLNITTKLLALADNSASATRTAKVFLGTLSSANIAAVSGSEKILDGRFGREARELLEIARQLKETDPGENYQSMVVRKQYDDFLERCLTLSRRVEGPMNSLRVLANRYVDGYGGDNAQKVVNDIDSLLQAAENLTRVVNAFMSSRGNLGAGSTVTVREGLSRGSLYRQRYRRY